MSIGRTVQLGDIKLAKIGHGLMGMSWVHQPVSDDVAFESIKASLDAVPPGVKMMLNSSEFYGNAPDFTHNIDLVSRFFEKYPEYADKAFLSIKGAFNTKVFQADNSPEGLRRSVENCIARLRGFKRIDLFEPARVDDKVPIDVQMKALQCLKDEGLFDYIGLSECSEASLRRAHAVAPVSMVEIEISPISYEDETRKVITACEELGILIAAYSPVGRGLLTGALTKIEDLDEEDHRRRFTRFSPENFNHNVQIAQALKNIGEPKGATVAQTAIAWVSAKGDHIIPIPGSSNKARTLENTATTSISLSPSEVDAIDQAVVAHEIKGGRGIDGMEKRFLLWG